MLTSNDGTLSPASIGSLATLPGVTAAPAAAPTAPAGSTWPSTNPLVNLAVGPLQFNAKWQSPVLASPFTMVNAPFQLLTGQSIVNPDGTTSAPTIQNLINAETTALGLLAGVPAAYVANTIAVITAVAQNPGSLLPSGLIQPAPSAVPVAAKTALALPASATLPSAKMLAATDTASPAASATGSAAPTAPAGSTWPSTNPVVNLLVGPLQFDAKFARSAVLASPFTIVNAPFQLLTGQSIVNPDGTTSAPTIQNLINAESKAFGLLVGLPGAYVTNTIAVVTALTQNPGSLLPSGLSLPAAPAGATVAKAPTSILTALGKTSTVDQKTVDTAKTAESKAIGSKSSSDAEPAKSDTATTPAEHAKPATLAEPVKVTTAAEPVKPVTAVEAVTPAEPAQPATPAEPAKAAEPKVNLPKVKLPTPSTKVGEVSGGVAPKAEDSAKGEKADAKDAKDAKDVKPEKSEKSDAKDVKADKGAAPKKSEDDSSSARKTESAVSSSSRSESGSGSSSSDSHSGASNGSSNGSSGGSSHSDAHKASSE
ncbi:hypothetical protein HNP40_002945 [Mycobacteroides chelonae]|nr:hypothetical protein [Mycobacteroides chelonae]